MTEFSEQWVKSGSVVMVDVPTTTALVNEIVRLREENQKLRNGFTNLGRALEEAPGLPLEYLSKDDLAKWTDLITGLLIALGTLEVTGKPIGTLEALCEAAGQ